VSCARRYATTRSWPSLEGSRGHGWIPKVRIVLSTLVPSHSSGNGKDANHRGHFRRISGTSVQIENVGFWNPNIERLLAKTKTIEERLRLCARNKDDELSEAALTFEGGSFYTNLPSSSRVKNRYCANPDCNFVESRAKNIATGGRLDLPGKLSKCSRCESGLYCSKECQKSDWKRHKKVCGSV
jgi:hypothetical protein